MDEILLWLESFNLDLFFEMLTGIGDFIFNAITEFIEGIDYIISTLIGSYTTVANYSVAFAGIVDNLVDQLPFIYTSSLIVLIVFIAFFIYVKKVF